ncbi:MAG: hypothetical protein SFV21_08885 [Rhodospirillaceae bacterium]|nr:hypothetical protein [Rhodospirillaceae bacterium]
MVNRQALRAGVLANVLTAIVWSCALLAAAIPKTVLAASFVVTDANFVGGVYEFKYFNDPISKTVINGVDVGLSDPTLTNTGWVCCRDDGPRFWHAAGAPFGFATQATGAATMGWDFSAVSGQIAKVEFNPRHFLFQFDPWNVHAVGDQIAGFINTPTSFGTGTYVELYRYTGQAGNTITVGAGTLTDYTSFLASSWLNNPALLELKFIYEQIASPLTIPAGHLQLFRDGPAATDEGFLFRVTLVDQPQGIPTPGAMALVALGLIAIPTARGRRR